MRKLSIVLLGVASSLLLAASAGAAALPFTGALTVAVGPVPPASIVGGGLGTSNGNGNLATAPSFVFFTSVRVTPLPQLRTGSLSPSFGTAGTTALLPLNKAGAGGLNGAATTTITTFGKNATSVTASTFAAQKGGNVIYAASPIVQIIYTNTGNSAFSGAPGGLTALNTGTYFGVAVAGGGVGGISPVVGAALLGLFNTAPAPQYPPAPGANLPVPLSVGGAGFGYKIFLGAVNLTLTGAGWTTGTAAVVASPGTTTTMGAPAFNVTVPTGMGGTAMVKVTRIPQNGFDLRSPAGVGPVQFVTPISVKTNIAGFGQIPVFAFLTLNYTPEPGTLLLVGAGIAGLAAVRRRSKR